ncbi:hypothetical protein TTRE_0000373701 [Trichuris trichiura]|uniref:Uncharacterized protein n=1 Tax=Trichuris trichiura TaxID=36087 RepID=A0A077Z9T9_TRITR|nr:hypothetical protein TTRE_0000373701 [Trichuris trichiura]
MLGIRSPIPTLDYLQRAEKFCTETYSGHNGTSQWPKYIKEDEIRELMDTSDMSTSFFLLWPNNFSFNFDNNAYTPTYTELCSSCPHRPFLTADFSTQMSVKYKASKDLIGSIVGKEPRKLCFSFDVFQPSAQRIFACDEYFQWDGFACYHSPFDPCEVTKECQFDRNHGKTVHHHLKCPNRKGHESRQEEEARHADPQETVTSEHYDIDV